MKPSEIRAELLAQHADLRAQMTATRDAAERCLRGDDAADELRSCIAGLTQASRAHNAREEELMSTVFPELDAWGVQRQEVMNEEHVAEHVELVAALVAAYAKGDPKALAQTAIDVVTELAEHMDREEKVFLGRDVLSDSGFPPDGFGG